MKGSISWGSNLSSREKVACERDEEKTGEGRERVRGLENIFQFYDFYQRHQSQLSRGPI